MRHDVTTDLGCSCADSLSRRTLELWLGQDPWLLGAATVLVPVGLAIRRLRPVTAAFAILAAVVLRPGYLPVPLVIGMLPFASLLVAGVADTVWAGRPAESKVPTPPAGAHTDPLALGPMLVVACLALTVAVIAPGWWQRDHELMTVDQDRPFRQAEACSPRGSREFDYLISTATLRSFPDGLPQARESQRRSRVVASFGRGTQRVEIREVQGSPL